MKTSEYLTSIGHHVGMRTLMLMIFAVTSSTTFAQAQDADEDDEVIDEITVTGTQIKGAAISDALAVTVFSEQDVEAMGISSGDELLDLIPE